MTRQDVEKKFQENAQWLRRHGRNPRKLEEARKVSAEQQTLLAKKRAWNTAN